MKNLKGFTVKYLGATNSRGSRCQIIDNLRGTKIVLSWDYNFSNVLDLALDYLKDKINIVGTTEIKEGYIILTDNFQYELKK